MEKGNCMYMKQKALKQRNMRMEKQIKVRLWMTLTARVRSGLKQQNMELTCFLAEE